MIGKLMTPILMLLVGACDWNQEPMEEEGLEQMEPGLGEQEELEVGGEGTQAAQAMRGTMERRLTAAEEWVTTRRQELVASGEEVSPEMRQQLDDLERRIQEVEQNMQQAGDEGLNQADQALTEIERDIQQFGQQPMEEPLEQEQEPFEEMEG